VNAKIVVVPPGTVAVLSREPGAVLPPVTYGSLSQPETAVAFIGLVVAGLVLARRVRGALVAGIAIATLAGLPLGLGRLPLLGFLMCSQIAPIDFTNFETAIPAFITLATLPMTYSISHGIGYGFITYTAIQALSGKARELHPLMPALALAFAAYFAWGVA
jgi:AGZA family xanthine/uracil permease-like MFS transporter